MSDAAALEHGQEQPTWVLFGELLSDCFPDEEVAGGAPFNVAAHLCALANAREGLPLLVSRIGQDERGEFLLRRVREVGLCTDAIQRDALHPSGCVEIQLKGGEHTFSIVPDQAWDFIATAPAWRALGIRRAQWLYFGTLAQRGASREALRALLQANAAQGFLDVNLREDSIPSEVLEWSFAHAEVVKLNDGELQRIAAQLDIDAQDPRDAAHQLMRRFDIGRVIVTEGARGAWSIDRDALLVRVAPQPIVEGFQDSVGAGDAFAAVCLLGLVRGWSVELLLARADRFAREICRIRGAVSPSLSFYDDFRAEFATDTVHST